MATAHVHDARGTVRLALGATTYAPDVHVGERIRVTKTPVARGGKLPRREAAYSFADVDRHGGLLWLGLAVVALALALLRWRGLLAIGGVALSLFIVLSFLVPAIFDGRSALLVALVASLAVMFMTLVLTNGIGIRVDAVCPGVIDTSIAAGAQALADHEPL
jgi:uncharacterized membrane protein